MKKVSLLLTLAVTSCASYKGHQPFKLNENVFYTEAKIERQSGDLYLPLDPKNSPVVILVHGGGWRSRDKSDMSSIAKSVASHGYTVFNINYRLSPEFKHPTPIDDLEAAYRFLAAEQKKYGFNLSSLGLWGYSSGGHTISQFVMTKNIPVTAVVSGGAPYDFSWYQKSPYINGYLGMYRDEDPKAYREASPVNRIHSGMKNTSFFLYHAIEDKLVEYSQSSSFEAKLKENGNEVEFYAVSFWGHAFAFAVSSGPVEQGIKFLDKKLKR